MSSLWSALTLKSGARQAQVRCHSYFINISVRANYVRKEIRRTPKSSMFKVSFYTQKIRNTKKSVKCYKINKIVENKKST